MTRNDYKTKTGAVDRQIANACNVGLAAVRAWGKLPSRHALALVALAKQRGIEITAEEILQ